MLHKIQVCVIFLGSILFIQAQQCPEIYQRYNDHHTYCLPANRSCTILKTGVTEQQQREILRLHNEFRSKIAMGNEHRAGGMPQAANMLELEWDDELAAVAQKLTETCVFGHDCSSCKQVRAFTVGQNIGHVTDFGLTDPGWERFITALYEEVQFFSNQKIDHYVEGPPAGHPLQYGHFTQMTWAKTWRVGCGWSLHKEGQRNRSYTACNYGPGGNVLNYPVYKKGTPCSQCPSNTCCGSACRDLGLTRTNYQGLCKVINLSKPPLPTVNLNEYLAYCDFRENQPYCDFSHEGQPWEKIITRGGNYLSIVLSGGQSSTLSFNTPISSAGQTCFELESRTAANSFRDRSSMNAMAWFKEKYSTSSSDISDTYLIQDTKDKRQSFMLLYLNMPQQNNMKFSLELSVPPGSPPQFFEIKRISAKNGACSATG